MASDIMYVLKHKKCDLWVAERAGSAARWDSREHAIEHPKKWWDKELNPDVFEHCELVEA